MVRLKVSFLGELIPFLGFQFQHGAIKSSALPMAAYQLV